MENCIIVYCVNNRKVDANTPQVEELLMEAFYSEIKQAYSNSRVTEVVVKWECQVHSNGGEIFSFSLSKDRLNQALTRAKSKIEPSMTMNSMMDRLAESLVSETLQPEKISIVLVPSVPVNRVN